MPRTITLRNGGDSYVVRIADDGTVRVDGGKPVQAATSSDGTIRVGAPPRSAWVAASADERWVFIGGEVFSFEVETRTRSRGARGHHHGSLSAPMPATVVKVHVSAGDAVKRGDTLIILEAMKMELPVRATANGTVTEVRCRVGELVQPGESLIELDEDEA